MPDLADILAPQYAGGLTPLQQQQAAQTQALSKLLGQSKSAIGDSSPVPNVTAGLARVLQAGIEGWGARQDAEAKQAAQNAAIGQFLRIGAGPSAATPSGFSDTNDSAKKGAEVSPSVAAPTKSASYDPNAIPSFVKMAGQPYGVSPDYLTKTAWIESKGDPNAVSPTGAKGILQFTGGTARSMGLTNPFDPAASADAGARLAAQNRGILQANLGRDPTDAELYLAHQQGAGGASKLLANPDARAGDVVGDHAVAVNGGDPNMSAGAFSRLWTGKYNSLQPRTAGMELPPEAQAGGDAPTQTAQADLPMQGATSASYTPSGDFVPDDQNGGFFIPPGPATGGGGLSMQPEPDMPAPAPPGPLSPDLTSGKALASVLMGGAPAPAMGTDQGNDPTVSPSLLSPPAAVVTGSAVPSIPAAGSFAAPLLPTTDVPPLPPVRPADLASTDVTPSPDWRTATAPPDQPLPVAKVADASGQVTPAAVVAAATPAQQLAKVLAPDLTTPDNAGAGDFARSGMGGSDALVRLLRGDPNPTTPPVQVAASGPAPGSVMSPAASGPAPVSPVVTGGAPAPVAPSPAPTPLTPAQAAAADPEVKVDGYDGTWSRAKVAAAAQKDPTRDGIPEDGELKTAQGAVSGPATTGSTTPAPAAVPGAQPRGPDSATPSGAPGYTPRAMAALSVMANDNAPAALRQAAQQIFSSEMNNNKGRVIYRDGTAYWLKGDGSAPETFEPDTKYKTITDPKTGRTFQYDEDNPKGTMTELQIPAGGAPSVTDLTPPLIPDGKGGMKPNPNAVQRNADGSLKLAYPSGQTINVNPGETEDVKSAAKRRNQPLDDAVDEGKGTQDQREALQVMKNAFLAAKANGGTLPQGYLGEQIQTLKSAAKSFGVDLGNVAEGDVVQKMNAVLAAASAKSISARGGTQFEFKTFLNNNPGLTQSDEGRMALIEILDGLAARKQAVSRIARAKDTNPDNFDERVAGYDSANPIVNPFDKTTPLTSKDTITPPVPAPTGKIGPPNGSAGTAPPPVVVRPGTVLKYGPDGRRIQ